MVRQLLPIVIVVPAKRRFCALWGDSNARYTAPPCLAQMQATQKPLFRDVLKGHGFSRVDKPALLISRADFSPRGPQAHKGTGAIQFVKDLVLEVPRLPLTYRSALSPTSSPVARAAFLRPYNIRRPYSLRDSLYFAQLQTTTMPLADLFNIANRFASRNLKSKISATFVVLAGALTTLAFPWDHTHRATTA